MREDELQELLWQADEPYGRDLPAPHETARRVRELDRRRRQRERRLAAGAALAFGVMLVGGWRLWPDKVAPPAEPARVQIADSATEAPYKAADIAAATQQEMARLAAEADFASRVANRMMAQRGLADATLSAARLTALDPLDEVRERLDIVAFRMVSEADRLQAAMQPAEEAIAIYREVIRLFPTTTSASTARSRLAALRES